ncbi:MAG: YraN family protein [Clostridia bacterium]|nr:YraN family protein [Clostridia bacterium]
MCLKQERGKNGENLACQYLQRNQYTIIDRNFRCRRGEIDIIACDIRKKELVFFEVKTRSSLKYGRPSETIRKVKRNRIFTVAKYYQYQNKIRKIPIRFDVIEVLLTNSNYKINHIKQAF